MFEIIPGGDDSSAHGPWASLAGARNGLRRLRSQGQLEGPATVILAPGEYPVTETLVFGPEDGRTTYKAARRGAAKLTGAPRLVGFREEGRGPHRRWILDLPEAAAGRLHFRSLFVNGRRRPRARWPKFSPDAAGVRNVLRMGQIRFPERRKLHEGHHEFRPVPGDFKAWPSLPDAEVVVLHYWVETRLGTPWFDEASGWVTCARRSVFNLYESFEDKLARYYIDNLAEALTDPGEWYLDRRAGRLTYLPLPGEKLASTELRAPRVCTFIRVAGDSFNRDPATLSPDNPRPVRDLRFDGLVFEDADWFHASEGRHLPHDRLEDTGVPLGGAPQASVHTPAVLEFKHAQDCSVTHSTIRRTGFYGLEFGLGCRDCQATGNTLEDLGAGGIRAGGSDLDGSPGDRVVNITLTGNRISDIGRIFHQGVGIILTNAATCLVAHNLIERTCYTGISCGWSWGYRDTVSRGNRIENNLIRHIGQGVLSDMGGIYLLGVQPGTVVVGNHIHDVTSASYGGWGIYADEGSSHITISSNWVHDTQGSPLNIHFARELVLRDNVFAGSAQEGLIGIGRVEGHVAANLFHNLLLGPAPRFISGGYRGDLREAFRSDANLIWFADGKIPPSSHPSWRRDVPRSIPWTAWLLAGHDRNSLLADPRARVTADSFSLPKNSPALALGFRPHDWTNCGPRSTP